MSFGTVRRQSNCLAELFFCLADEALSQQILSAAQVKLSVGRWIRVRKTFFCCGLDAEEQLTKGVFVVVLLDSRIWQLRTLKGCKGSRGAVLELSQGGSGLDVTGTQSQALLHLMSCLIELARAVHRDSQVEVVVRIARVLLRGPLKSLGGSLLVAKSRHHHAQVILNFRERQTGRNEAKSRLCAGKVPQRISRQARIEISLARGGTWFHDMTQRLDCRVVLPLFEVGLSQLQPCLVICRVEPSGFAEVNNFLGAGSCQNSPNVALKGVQPNGRSSGEENCFAGREARFHVAQQVPRKGGLDIDELRQRPGFLTLRQQFLALHVNELR